MSWKMTYEDRLRSHLDRAGMKSEVAEDFIRYLKDIGELEDYCTRHGLHEYVVQENGRNGMTCFRTKAEAEKAAEAFELRQAEYEGCLWTYLPGKRQMTEILALDDGYCVHVHADQGRYL